jgi:hypothetical protein
VGENLEAFLPFGTAPQQQSGRGGVGNSSTWQQWFQVRCSLINWMRTIQQIYTRIKLMVFVICVLFMCTGTLCDVDVLYMSLFFSATCHLTE